MMEYNVNNTTNNNKKTTRNALSFLKSARTGLCVLGSTLLIAFVVLPLSLRGVDGAYTSNAETMNFVDMHAPSPTPAPTPFPIASPTVVPEAKASSLPQIDPASEVAVTETPIVTAAVVGLSYQRGDEDEEIKLIQSRLMELEYMDFDEPTSLFGPATESAISRFQEIYEIESTGQADEMTLALLFSDDASTYLLKRGDSGSGVLSLQEQLDSLGYYEGKFNGFFGAATEEALRAFQTKNKLNATGVANSETLSLIYSPDARPKIDPTPTPTPKPTPKPTVKPTATPKPSSSSKTPTPSTTITTPSVNYGSGVEGMIAVALAQQGKPYVKAGKGPNEFDCSGLVYYSLNQAGYSVGRYTADSYSKMDKWLYIGSYSELRRGDLIFFWSSDAHTRIGHVAIYLGNGRYVHASSSASQVLETSWGNWSDRYFANGRRVFY